MKVSDMVDGKIYKCEYLHTLYTGWTKQSIIMNFPWMVDMDIWEVEE
jgi:hypothetical protein